MKSHINDRIGTPRETERVNQWLPRAGNGMGEEMGVTANGFRVSFWEYVLKVIVVMATQL